MKRIYLDNAATTPVDPLVVDVMSQVLQETYGNPSSIHALGRTARNTIEQARKQIASYLNASIGEIYFTSGGTESNNMAIKCAVRDLGVQRIITSPTEHHCVLHTLDHLPKEEIEVVLLTIDQAGNPDMDELEGLLKESSKKTLVSLMYANNEIGTLCDVDEVSKLCQEYGAFFHSDSVQAVGHFPIDVSETYFGFLSGSAHKFHGPKGIGFIYINSENLIKPYIDGGSQERNMRGGTENIYGIAGMARALDLAVSEIDERRTHIERIRTYLKTQLQASFPGISFNGNQEQYLYTVLSVNFPPGENIDMLLLNLDIFGICASGGSACSSGSEKGSHVMEAIGVDPGSKTVRFSFSHFNTIEEIDFVIEKLKSIIPQSQGAGMSEVEVD